MTVLTKSLVAKRVLLSADSDSSLPFRSSFDVDKVFRKMVRSEDTETITSVGPIELSV